jgi:hypothetical protein
MSAALEPPAPGYTSSLILSFLSPVASSSGLWSPPGVAGQKGKDSVFVVYMCMHPAPHTCVPGVNVVCKYVCVRLYRGMKVNTSVCTLQRALVCPRVCG